MLSSLRPALLLYVFLMVGVFLLFVPWTSIWEQAILALMPQERGEWLLSGWVRGCVSGIGALDLFVAAQLLGELWGGVQRRR